MANNFDDILDYLRAAASGIGSAVQGQFESYFGAPTQGGVVMGAGPVPKPKPPSEMDIASRFISEQEGFSATPYSDYKQTSIGYGTKARRGDKSISKSEALARLQTHLQADVSPQLRNLVNPAVWDSLSHNQRAALMSLTYNIGYGTLSKSKALEALNRSDFPQFEFEAFDDKQGFVKAGGKVSKGLQERREKERRLWGGG